MQIENLFFQLQFRRRDNIINPSVAKLTEGIEKEVLHKIFEFGEGEKLYFDSSLITTRAEYTQINLKKIAEKVGIQVDSGNLIFVTTEDFTGISATLEDISTFVRVLDKLLPNQGNFIGNTLYVPSSAKIDFSLVLRDAVLQSFSLSHNTYTELINSVAERHQMDLTRKYAQIFPYLRPPSFLQTNLAISEGRVDEVITRVTHPRLIVTNLNLPGDFHAVWKITSWAIYNYFDTVESEQFSKDALEELEVVKQKLKEFLKNNFKSSAYGLSETN